MALNCERKNASGSGEPCGECDSCRRIWAGTASLDVVEIDAASNRGVDDARQLRERAMYAASGPDRHKVYIVDEAHMLTREAWNALLKILEEPPSRVVFVFATTEPQKIANTSTAVLSRLQRFDFRAMGPTTIAGRLRQVAQAEQLEVDPDAVVLISRVANGGMRDALSLLDQAVVFSDGPITAAAVRGALGLISDELYAELLTMVARRDAKAVFPFVDRLVEQGADLGEFVNGMGEVWRAFMLSLVGGEPEGLTEEVRAAITETKDQLSEGDVLRVLRMLADAEVSIRRSANPRLQVEALLMQWTLLDRTVEIARLLEAIGGERSEGREAGETGAKPRSPAKRRSQAPARAPSDAPPSPRSRSSTASEPIDAPATLDGLKEKWTVVTAAVGGESRMLQEALVHASPVELDGDRLTLSVTEDLHVEGIRRNRRVLEDAIYRVLGHRVSVATAAPRPSVPQKRQSASDAREDRLRTFRAQDPGLDVVADALNLELMD